MTASDRSKADSATATLIGRRACTGSRLSWGSQSRRHERRFSAPRCRDRPRTDLKAAASRSLPIVSERHGALAELARRARERPSTLHARVDGPPRRCFERARAICAASRASPSRERRAPRPGPAARRPGSLARTVWNQMLRTPHAVVAMPSVTSLLRWRAPHGRHRRDVVPCGEAVGSMAWRFTKVQARFA